MEHPRRVARAATALLLSAIAVAAVPAPVAAPAVAAPVHDAEFTQVEVRFFSDRSFQIDVMNPPDWLITTLEPLSDAPSATILTGEARDRRIQELMPKFAEWIWILFDGNRIEAFPEYLPELRSGPVENPIAPPLATIRMRGRAPEGTAQFSLAYGLLADPYPMTAIQTSGEPRVVWVEGPVESERVDIVSLLPPPWYSVVATYLRLGFEHILPDAPEHVLFAMGIFALGASLLPLLALVGAFTVAHTVALALTVSGVVALRPTIVGPMIGLSLAYLASEVRLESGLERGRIGLVFALGLLFGTGFAGGLELPTSDHAAAIASYNLGIAGAQLAVLAALFAALGWTRKRAWYRARVVLPMSALVGGLGLYLSVTRWMGG